MCLSSNVNSMVESESEAVGERPLPVEVDMGDKSTEKVGKETSSAGEKGSRDRRRNFSCRR